MVQLSCCRVLGKAKSISMVTYISGGGQVENGLLKGINGRKYICLTKRREKKLLLEQEAVSKMD